MDVLAGPHTESLAFARRGAQCQGSSEPVPEEAGQRFSESGTVKG